MNRVLVISTGLNVLLLAVMLWNGRHPEPIQREVRVAPAALPFHQRTGSERALHPALSSRIPTLWDRLDAADTSTLIANLRAVGCPEQTIRDIVLLRVSRAYREQMVQLEAELRSRLTGNWLKDNPERARTAQARAEIRLRMQNELESLLGVDWEALVAPHTGWPEQGETFLKSLSREKRAAVRQVELEFREQLEALRQKVWSGELDSGGAAAMRELEQQKLAALAGILSPPEMNEYLYRESPAAKYVRQYAPEARDEAEYRRMVQLALELGMNESDANRQSHTPVLVLDEQLVEERAARLQDFNSRLEELLGENRIAQMHATQETRKLAERQAQDERSRQEMLVKLTDQAALLGVSAPDAERFFHLLLELEPVMRSRFRELEKSFTGTPEEIQKQMEAAIRAELNVIATEVMGAKGPEVVEKAFLR